MPTVSEAQHRLMECAAHTEGGCGGVSQAVGKEFVKADSASQDCAGILFRAPGPHYLLVKRSDSGEWEQPGGHVETGETALDAAIRECLEEIGVCPDGERVAARRTPLVGGGEYTCFLQDVDIAAFDGLVLNNEHTKWRWVHPGGLPKPMLREVAKTIELLTGHETDIAKRITRGELLSPQKYENIWLFDVRITGTGTSYRPMHEEIAFRTPEKFLTDEFLERCNGLPLIFEHPKKSILDTDEYRSRSIGTVVLPYIKGDEVWGIAKVFDADGAALMRTTHASTSPAVVFRDAGSTETIEVDGLSVLIEGKPSYLDHLAICEVGVWDKGGEPSGVSNSGEISMDQKEDVPAWADALMKRMDSVCERMDSIEKGGADSVKKDAAEESKVEERKDSEAKAEEDGKKEEAAEKKAEAETKAAEKSEEKAEKAGEEERKEERADSVSRAEVESLRAQIATLTRPLTNEDRDALASAQARADGIAQLFGQEASAPLHGESPIAYRKRLAAKYQKHSTKVANVRLDSVDGAAFDLVEEQIYADAAAFARSPEQRQNGVLIPITRRDTAGRNITTYEGDMGTWLNHFKSAGHGVRFNRAGKEA